MDFSIQIAKSLNLKPSQVEAAVQLIDEGNTLPFIARYRKEMTGSLDDEQLLQISTLLEKLRALQKRRETILASISEQGKLTPELDPSPGTNRTERGFREACPWQIDQGCARIVWLLNQPPAWAAR